MDFGNSAEVSACDLVDLALTDTPLYAVGVQEVRLHMRGGNNGVLLLGAMCMYMYNVIALLALLLL